MPDPRGSTRSRRRVAVGRAADTSAARRRGALGAVGLTTLIAASLVVIALREDPAPDAEPVGAVTPFAAEPVPTPPPPGPDGAAGPAEDVDEPLEGDPRVPTTEEAAAFAADHRPDGGTDVQAVTVDLDGDGVQEVVVAAVLGTSTAIEVAVWTGDRYEVAFRGRGGPAEELTGFEVVDVTGDGRREIVLAQHGADRESVALWGMADGGVEPQVARGGCWDGTHVFGSAGAVVGDGELRATCDPALAPGETHLYTWDGQRWTYEETEAA